ncbi:MAG: efflux transporter outer membrane subunit [Phycisphaeraceae bacterium]|nr:efflux transporter outer membrane subunit [Phycisphaeraceae bacterium]
MARAAFLILAVLVLQGCLVGPDYERPEITTPPGYRGDSAQGDAASIADLPWWEVYQDPTLQDLIGTAISNNYDLRIAIARIEQARAIAAQSRSELYPSIGYGAAVSSGRNEFLGSPSVTNGSSSSPFAGVLNAAWELDVWGRIRRLNEADLAELLATEEARRAVLLSLVSEVARTYFELLELDLEVQIGQATTESFGESLRIFEARLRGGTASKLETSRAEAALASAAATIPSLQRTIAFRENQLSVLLGRPPGAIERPIALSDSLVPPEVPAGLPADLLARRPDVRAAEQSLRAANARIGVAIGNYFPQIGLTAFLGKVSPELGAITGGATNAWSVAASATGPIFTAGLLEGQLQQARGAWQQSALEYELTVLNALQEVSTSLISREKLVDVRRERERSVRAYQEAVKVSTQRYVAGKSSYYEVLEAQQQLFPEQLDLARTRLDQLIAVVNLYKSLGGGWRLTTEEWGTTEPLPLPPDQRPKDEPSKAAPGDQQ